MTERKKKKKTGRLKPQAVMAAGVIVAVVVAAVFFFTAGNRKKKVLTVGSEKIYMKEAVFYALQLAYDYHLSSTDSLDEFYDGETTYAEHYKNELKQRIIDAKVMYICAVQQGIQLNKEDKDVIEAQTAETLSNIGAYLDKFQIDEALAHRILTEQYYGELLKKTVIPEETEEAKYFHTYNLLFPTVYTNEDGTLLVDENGYVISMNETDREKQYELAMKAVELSKTDITMDSIAKELGVSESSGDIYGELENYDSEAYVEEVKRLDEGMVSDIIQTDYGYNVFCLVSADDREYAESVRDQEASLESSELLDEQMEKWRQEANLDELKAEGSLWEDFSMKNYVLY